MTPSTSLRVLLLGVLCAVCLSTVAAPPIVVAGRIANIPPDGGTVASVLFCDPFNSSNDRVAVRLVDNGSFRATYAGLRAPQNITINYAGRFINLFVAPGDSVWVDIDAATFDLRFSGSNAAFNSALAPLCDYVYRLSFPQPNDTLPPAKYIEQVKQAVGGLHDSIARYAAHHKVPREVQHWAERDAVYLVANYLLDYQPNDPAAQWAVYSDPLFAVDDQANFCTMLFSTHLGATLGTLIKLQIKTHQAEWDSLPAADRSVKAIEWTTEALRRRKPSLSRDYMLWYLIDRYGTDLPDVARYVSAADFTDPSIYVALAPQATKELPTVALDGVVHLNNQTPEAVPEGDLLALLAQKYPNKVLYIDAYATWCGPCRAEFKVSGALHELFEGKEVVFVNLCLSSDREKWLPLIEQFAVQGEHYFLPDDATKLFMSAYGLEGVPTYLVVDRQGKLVSNKAPRPSQTVAAAELLDQLLKQ